MKLRAKVINHLPTVSGTSKQGTPWTKATVIVETIEQYPKVIALSNFKKAQELEQLPVGTVVNFDVDLESREYNGRWYTEVTTWAWQHE